MVSIQILAAVILGMIGFGLTISGAMAAIIKALLLQRIEAGEKKADRAEEKATEIEENYLTRFEGIKGQINETHSLINALDKNIVQHIGDLKVMLEKEFTRKDDCVLHKSDELEWHSKVENLNTRLNKLERA